MLNGNNRAMRNEPETKKNCRKHIPRNEKFKQAESTTEFWVVHEKPL